jgi:hypothetical protein
VKLRVITLAIALLAVWWPAHIVCTVAASAATPAPAAASPPRLFQTEAAAQAHCPRDIVVWLNLPSSIYHLKGERWYARTKRGAFVCKREADAAGDRETLNGQ